MLRGDGKMVSCRIKSSCLLYCPVALGNWWSIIDRLCPVLSHVMAVQVVCYLVMLHCELVVVQRSVPTDHYYSSSDIDWGYCNVASQASKYVMK